MTIIWCMVPETWSMTDRIFCHSGLFFAPLPPIWTQKIKILKKIIKKTKTPEDIIILHMCIVWCMVPEISSIMDRIVCHLDHFLPFYPSNNIITLHKHIKNHDHVLYCSLDVGLKGCNCYFSFWAIFCPFNCLTVWKIKILKNEKKPYRYHHFTTVYQESWSYAILFLRYDPWQM